MRRRRALISFRDCGRPRTGVSFGEAVAGDMRLSRTGRLVSDCWQWLETQYAYVALDE